MLMLQNDAMLHNVACNLTWKYHFVRMSQRERIIILITQRDIFVTNYALKQRSII